MGINNFFPSTEADQILWLGHYLTRLPDHGPACGIPESEIATTQTDLQYYIWMLQHWHPATQHLAKEATVYKQAMINAGDTGGNRPQLPVIPEAPTVPPPGLQKRLFAQVARIKLAAAYNETIGHNLGIIGSNITVDHPVPEYSVSVELGTTGMAQVRIDFKKYGHDGIWIESRINGGDWAFLAIDTVKPYLDQRPITPGNQHETREYRLRWWDKSQPNGEWSTVQKAVLG